MPALYLGKENRSINKEGWENGEEGLPFPSEIKKKKKKIGLVFEKKTWMCWVKFFIKAALRVLRNRNLDIFPCGGFLLCVVDEMFIKTPLFQETIPGLENFWLHTWRSSTYKNRNYLWWKKFWNIFSTR